MPNTIKFTHYLSLLLLLTCFTQSHAQSSSFLADGVQDFVRREQLVGSVDPGRGLMNQCFQGHYGDLDSLLTEWRGGLGKKGGKGPFKLQWLPFSVSGEYNSNHPFGWNDGAMIPAAGVQGLVSGGLFWEAGHLSVQLKPEFVYAQNTAFETFPTEYYNGYWASYYNLVLNKIDMPEQFGLKAYHKLYPGQSSIRYSVGALSAGISTENLWWGPGRFNALVMSNNAPGFVHATLNTTKPIVTKIGSFEGQLIAGSLSSSGILPSDTNRYYNGVRLYEPKNNQNRYIAGFTLTWQPIWVKGLFVGFAKASYLYHSDISGIADIFPLEGIIKSSTEKNGKKASLGSLFARYVMPEEHAELYFEFGRTDKSPSLLNIFTDRDYPRGYVAGFRKLFNLKRRDQFIEFAFEFTQLELPTTQLIAQAASWYTNPFVQQGYTNEGKVLGAGIGPGSDEQLVDISWVKGFKKIGLKFERLVHNNDFYYSAFENPIDYTRHWIDLSTTLHADWQYKSLLFSSQMALIRSLNYEWIVLPGLGYFKNGFDLLNFHAVVSVAYRF